MAKLSLYSSVMNAGKSTAVISAAHNYAVRGLTEWLFTT
jgi:thymidine kinase